MTTEPHKIQNPRELGFPENTTFTIRRNHKADPNPLSFANAIGFLEKSGHTDPLTLALILGHRLSVIIDDTNISFEPSHETNGHIHQPTTPAISRKNPPKKSESVRPF